MKTDYLPEQMFQRLLESLMPANALILRLMTDTGLRISDVVSIQKKNLLWPEEPGTGFLYSYEERKTRKERTVYIAPDLARELEEYGRKTPDSPFLFPGRDIQKHRTRQAVWKDLNRCAELWRVNGKKLRRNLGTHSARKIYAVKLYKKLEREGADDPLNCVRIDLNHKDLAVTFLYAMADIISERRRTSK